jgi:hypothetical protein
VRRRGPGSKGRFPGRQARIAAMCMFRALSSAEIGYLANLHKNLYARASRVTFRAFSSLARATSGSALAFCGRFDCPCAIGLNPPPGERRFRYPAQTTKYFSCTSPWPKLLRSSANGALLAASTFLRFNCAREKGNAEYIFYYGGRSSPWLFIICRFKINLSALYAIFRLTCALPFVYAAT